MNAQDELRAAHRAAHARAAERAQPRERRAPAPALKVAPAPVPAPVPAPMPAPVPAPVPAAEPVPVPEKAPERKNAGETRHKTNEQNRATTGGVMRNYIKNGFHHFDKAAAAAGRIALEAAPGAAAAAGVGKLWGPAGSLVGLGVGAATTVIAAEGTRLIVRNGGCKPEVATMARGRNGLAKYLERTGDVKGAKESLLAAGMSELQADALVASLVATPAAPKVAAVK